MSVKSQQLLNALKCTELMLQDAKAGNWEKVMRYENKRSELLEQLFSGSAEDNSVAGMDQKIQKIIDLNTQLEAITREAREETRSSMASMSKGRQAVNMYAQHSA